MASLRNLGITTLRLTGATNIAAAIEGGADRRLHSIHAYFMRPGDDTQPITFSVERMRDGRAVYIGAERVDERAVRRALAA